MNRAPNPFAEQPIDIAADDDAEKEIEERRCVGLLTCKKKTQIEVMRSVCLVGVFKYNNARETQKGRLEEGGSAKSVRPREARQLTAVCH